ncbi:MAG: lipopolysaccharide heptosyltransferase II [Candidatus Brocadiae bacterium]|nr:lipopolysaccharide heptosyltransferase II [Candidatus Brocadiia bacterium]
MEKILVVKISALGDILHSLPVLKALKESQPNLFIGWLVARAYKEILEGNPYIDRIFLFERERWRGLKNCLFRQQEIWRLLKEIRAEGFDTCLDLQGLFRSGFFTLLSGASHRLGFAHAREFSTLAYNNKVSVPHSIIHAVDRNSYLVEKLIQKPVARDFPIFLSEQDKQKASSWLQGNPCIVMVPGTRWPSKRWPAKHFARLMDGLFMDYNATIALVGAKGDSGLGEQILGNTKFPEKVVNLIGKTSIKELCAVMAKADLVISNDSGPMHIAAAMGSKILALFGPTDTQKTSPYGENHIVLQHLCGCNPCRNRVCKKNPTCMEQLSPEEVRKNIAF